MYKALIMPHFNYCSTVWQNNNQTHLDKLYKLQKRANNNKFGLYYKIFEHFSKT